MGSFKLIFLIPFFSLAQIDDNTKHIYASWGITMLTTEVSYHFNGECTKSILIGSSTSLVIGVLGKEIINDKLLKRGVFNKWDIADDIWGTAIAVVIEICIMDVRKQREYNKRVRNDYRMSIFEN